MFFEIVAIYLSVKDSLGNLKSPESFKLVDAAFGHKSKAVLSFYQLIKVTVIFKIIGFT